VSHDASYSADGKRAVVDVSGAVQASFNGTGQYVGAQQGSHGTQTAEEHFTLVKQGKQWRITNPPKNRMLTEPDFARVYKPQDLYFFDSIGQVLVPDAVFVPTGDLVDVPGDQPGHGRCWPTRSRYGCRTRAAPPRRPSPRFPRIPAPRTST